MMLSNTTPESSLEKFISLFHLINMGWLALEDVRCFFDLYDYVVLTHYNNRPDKWRYSFVIVSQNEAISTPSQSM